MTIHRPIFAALVSLVVLSAAVRAQQPSGAQVNARIVCLSLSGEALSDLVVTSSPDPLETRAPKDYLSDPVDYRGPARLTFQTKQALSAPPALDPETGRPLSLPPLATVDLPAEGGEFLLLFGGKPGEYRVAALDFSSQAAPLGSYLFWNFSGRPLGLQLGAQNHLLKPGTRELVRAGVEDRSYIALRVFDEDGGKARQLFASRHFHRETTRQLVFITSVPDTDRVRLKIITQRVFEPFKTPEPPLAAMRR
ncbi:MAG: hypothetical protein ABII82_17355 [Verrucomicrobiota bacterium]